jgi:hypothetical protein
MIITLTFHSINSQFHSDTQVWMRNMAVKADRSVSFLNVMQEGKRSINFNRSGTRKRFCARNVPGSICQFPIEKGSHWTSEGAVQV